MLEKSRKEIDELDAKIIKLLARRLELCKEIGEYKRKHGQPIQNAEREKEVIEDRAGKLKQLGFDDQKFAGQLFGLIMSKAREVQKQR